MTAPRAFDVGPNRVRHLRDGAEAYPAMLAAIAGAEREVLVEMYWFMADRTGLSFRDALVERARAGVRVRVSFDSVGSLGVGPELWAPLVAAGGEVHEYAPISPLARRFKIRRVTFRDHRKIIVVDGVVGFTGGLNVGDPWSPPEHGGEGWRDDVVEVRGPAAGELRALFFEMWKRTGHRVPRDFRKLPRQIEERVAVLANPLAGARQRGISRAYRTAIGKARSRIDIANAYFLPSAAILAALRRARRRGVQIRILVPGRTDVWLVSLAVASLIGGLVDDGIHVHAYRGPVLHAKTAVFDEDLAMIGSSNLDMRSWRYNLECNLAVWDAEFAKAVRASFEEDLAASEEIALDRWRERPLWLRAAAWVASLFRQYL